MELLTLLLHHCLLAILSLKYFPASWRTWLTIVLPKPNRPDYTGTKSYHPIALYNTMGKVVSAVITDILVYLTVHHSSSHPSALVGSWAAQQLTHSSTWSTTLKMPGTGKKSSPSFS